MFLFRKLSGRSGVQQDDSNTGCHDQDDISKQALEQASEHVNKGDYEEALWILERLGKFDPAIKGIAELAAVAEVCNAAVLGMCSCSKGNRNPDWYKILKVDEKSDISIIKKQYRNLALLLHPDKNKHMKAEAAFKLVSEGFMEPESASVMEPESASAMECQELKHSTEKDFCGIAKQPEENAILRKESLHRQPCQNDNLHLQETILRTQREKSEQLLKTLQRLRDETRTVAASLNHLYFARS